MTKLWRAEGCVPAVIVCVLLGSANGALIREKRATLSCSAGQALVYTGYLYDTSSCATLIGQITDHYKLEYRQECQRWLGSASLPASVVDAHLPTSECYQYTNGTTRYRAEVCCKTQVTTQRCFTCSKRSYARDPQTGLFNSIDCDHGGQVNTCSAGQVCQTVFESSRTSTGTIQHAMQKTCAQQSTCSVAQTNNANVCKDGVDNPTCTLCCTGTFCNYNTQNIQSYTKTPSGVTPTCACQNGGSCIADGTDPRGYRCACVHPWSGNICHLHICSTSPCNGRGACDIQAASPFFKCACKAGWTGQKCETARSPCATNVCKNGGTCYDHGSFGTRCVCPAGYVGSLCEFKRPITCKNANQHILGNSENKVAQTTESCTSIIQAVEKDTKLYSMKQLCQLRLGGTGLHPQVFQDATLPSITLNTCNKGDTATYISYEACCPACFSNPCQNDGLCTSLDDGNDFVCKCHFGFEGKRCENRISLCLVSGDPHVKTFDRERLTYQGKCKYALVQPKSTASIPAFNVEVKNENRGSNTRVSYTKYVEVRISGYVVRINRDKVTTVDGVEVFPDVFYSGFSIVNNGRFVRLETSFGMAVESDGFWLLIVKVPDNFASNVEGLCGNFDGNRLNDFTLRNGTDVSSDPHKSSHVANSWKVNDPEDPSCPSTIDETPPPCPAAKETLFRTNDYCGLIKDKSAVFSACLNDAAIWSIASAYEEDCLFDTCANQNNLTAAKEAACGSLEVLAMDCASKGHVTNWRSAAGCPLLCPAGSNMVYKHQTSACIPSCSNPEADKTCGLPETESCTCPSGQLLWKGNCVTPDKCGCRHSNNYFNIGDSWYSSDCAYKFSCVACTSCTYPIGVVVNTTSSCPQGRVCKKDGNDIYGCHQNAVNGNWSSWSNWKLCSAGSCSTGQETRTRQCNNPAPSNGGLDCVGLSSETRNCTCRDGRWSFWSPWSACPQGSCATGQVSRRRSCTNPTPANGGMDCVGNAVDSRPCSCPVAAWSDWSQWSSCGGKCGAGKQTRQRQCDNPPPTKGGDSCTGSNTDSRNCACGQAFDPKECDKCKLVSNVLGYLPDTCDCAAYYQCERGVDNEWIGHHRECAPCTIWSQTAVTCIRNPATPDCEAKGPQNPDTCQGGTDTRKAHPDKTKYIWVVHGVEYTMPCPIGTSFNLSRCICDHDVVLIPAPMSILCLPFGRGWNGFAAGSGWGWVDVRGVSIGVRKAADKCAYFDGSSRLEIPRFTNYVPQKGFSVSFLYKRTGGSGGQQGLLSNGDCQIPSSVEIISTSQTTLSVKVRSQDQWGNAHSATISSISASYNTWHHVVYSYDGKSLTVYVDKVKYVATSAVPGKLLNTYCTMVVGADGNKQFTGYMDELCFYEGPMGEGEVHKIYSKIY